MQISATLARDVVLITPEDALTLWEFGYFGTSPKRDPRKKPIFCSLALWEAYFLMDDSSKVDSSKDDSCSLQIKFQLSKNEEFMCATELLQYIIEFLGRGAYLRTLAYCEMRRKGWRVQSGLNYGADFLLYRSSPETEHAPFAVMVAEDIKEGEGALRWRDVVAINRVAATARKRLIIAFVTDKPIISARYLQLSRWNPEAERGNNINTVNNESSENT